MADRRFHSRYLCFIGNNKIGTKSAFFPQGLSMHSPDQGWRTTASVWNVSVIQVNGYLIAVIEGKWIWHCISHLGSFFSSKSLVSSKLAFIIWEESCESGFVKSHDKEGEEGVICSETEDELSSGRGALIWIYNLV